MVASIFYLLFAGGGRPPASRAEGVAKKNFALPFYPVPKNRLETEVSKKKIVATYQERERERERERGVFFRLCLCDSRRKREGEP